MVRFLDSTFYSFNKRGVSVLCCAKLLQSCLTVCDPIDYSPPSSSAHGVLQARILEWVAISSSRGSSQPRDQTHVSYVSCTGRFFFTTSTTWEAPIEYLLCQLQIRNRVQIQPNPILKEFKT